MTTKFVRRPALSAMVVLSVVVPAGCSEQQIAPQLKTRIVSAFHAAGRYDGVRIDYSTSTRVSNGNDVVQQCVTIQQEPRSQSPHGIRFEAAYLGAGAVLGADGTCEGGSTQTFRQFDILDGLVYTQARYRPPFSRVRCDRIWQRRTITPAVRPQLESWAGGTSGPDVAALLGTALRVREPTIVGSTTSIVFELDPAKAAKAAKSPVAGTSGRGSTPRTTTIRVDLGPGDQLRGTTVEVTSSVGRAAVRAVYSKIGQPQGIQPDTARCVEPSVGTLTSLSQLKELIGASLTLSG